MKTVLFCLLFLCANLTLAEPYFAVREGFTCSTCHVNPTGGGMRNSFGNAYGQNQLTVTTLNGSSDSPWTGEIAGPISIGANARYSARQFDIDNTDTATSFNTDRVSLYVGATLNDRVSVMIDQQVAPGGSLNRESWLKLNYGNWYLKAGKLFQPFGWRLEDDSAYIRQVTGINFNTGDNGVELGVQHGSLSTQFAITNGAGGGAETDDGKQVSLRVAQSLRNFQWGVSANVNNTDNGDRRIGGLFFGFNTGPVTWLGEFDHIDDKDFVTDVDQDLALLEANYLIAKGHNLKLTLEAQHFDDNTEDRMRYSLVWEYFPISFSQFRLGVRERESDDINVLLNARELFAQLHVYF